MQDYLSYRFEDSENFVNTFDELPLWSAPFGQLLLRHVPVRHGMTVADIGCCTGFPLLELAARMGHTCKLYGIDPWTNAINRAKVKIADYGLGNVELIEASAEQMPFNDHTVDLIVSNLGINNFERPASVFAECARVLKKGGTLALATNVTGHWNELYRVFEYTLQQLGKDTTRLLQDERHRVTKDTISDLFTAAGLTVSRYYEDSFIMRFTDGSAFLRHHFIKLGWLTTWMGLFPAEELPEIFAALEHHLNAYAEGKGELALSVPMLYMEGVKP